MRFKRFMQFLFEAGILLPLSTFINVFALGPLFVFFSEGEDVGTMNMILMIPLMWVLAFFFSKLKIRLKGKTTDQYYDVNYLTVNPELTEYDDYIELKATVDATTRTESSNTGWGFLGIILSFVALPLQLIATVMAYMALFFPVIYSTAKPLPKNRRFSTGNKILHILFDFVIIPSPSRAGRKADVKGVLCVILYIIGSALLVVTVAIVAQFIEWPAIPLISVIGGIVTAFTMLSFPIMLIKYCVLVVWDYRKETIIRGAVYLVLFILAFGVGFSILV